MVIEKTSVEKVTYVGHSQGTTQMFYALSTETKAKVFKMVNLYVALAPVARLNGADWKLRTLCSQISKIHYVLDHCNIYRIADKDTR
jgi:pimeloyl-ACP methyl ester carboxylesterase